MCQVLTRYRQRKSSNQWEILLRPTDHYAFRSLQYSGEVLYDLNFPMRSANHLWVMVGCSFMMRSTGSSSKAQNLPFEFDSEKIMRIYHFLAFSD